MRLAKKFGYDLKVVWDTTAAFPCQFDELFENTEFRITNNFDYLERTDRKIRSPYEHPEEIATFVEGEGSCSVTTYKFILEKFTSINWHEELTEEFHRLRPIPKIQRLINGLEVNRGTIGIHLRKPEIVRQPGKTPPYMYSPDKFVYERMDTILNSRPSQKFFLSSDCKPTQNRFVKRYGDSLIISHKTERPLVWDWRPEFEHFKFIRATTPAIQEAFVDLVGLMRCGSIIRNFPSTFSTFAGDIGDVPVHTV